MVFCLGEPPRRFLFCCCIFICLCFSFCCCSFHCFSTSSLTLSWTIVRVLHPFCTFSLAHRRLICNTFTIPLSSYLERYGFEWAFFTHRRFLPYAPSQHFWHILTFLAHSQHFGTTCFYQGFAGNRQLLS